jgi:hypothetical protein
VATQIERPETHPGRGIEAPGSIPALSGLLRDLTDTSIRWCSWKSNEHLSAALAGRTDLDLLVHAGDLEAFRAVLTRHGLKPIAAPPPRAYPGMEHHLGLDRASGRLFHLHVHTRLVLGEQHIKNHRIPMEDAVLSSVRLLDGVPVPAPELELAILTVRTLLKYRARDVVKDVLRIRSHGLKRPIRDELDWLLTRSRTDLVEEALHAAGDPVPPAIVRAFLNAYVRDPRSGATFARLRGRLRRDLARYQREGRTRARTRAAWSRIRSSRRPHLVRMTPGAGGRTFALVGSDGSGKSTVAAEVSRWLGWKLAVRVVYLGSKTPSRPSRWSYIGFRALRRGGRSAGRRVGQDSRIPRLIDRARDSMLAAHHVAVARDRERRCRAGRNDARAGRIVIFDRYPLDALSRSPEHRLLDGPRIGRTLPPRGLTGRLGRIEERMYERFGLPDVLVFLRIDPQEASRRKPDHRVETLVAKSRAADELALLGDRSGGRVRVVRIDANAPLAEVLLDVKRELWDVI